MIRSLNSRALSAYLIFAFTIIKQINVFLLLLIPQVKASTMAFPIEGRDYTFAENVLLRGLQFFGNTSSAESTELIFQLGLLMHLTDRVASAVPMYEAVLRAQPTAFAAVSAMATAVHSLGEFRQVWPRFFLSSWLMNAV